MQTNTLPKLMKRNYYEYGNKVAIREKTRGIWKRYTWKEYYEKVELFTLGLLSLGLQKGDSMCILGETTPEIFWAELAIQTARGTAVGIFTDCVAAEVKFYFEYSDSKYVLAYDQEQVDKMLLIKNELPLLKKIIYCDQKGLWFYDDPMLISFEEVLELGKVYKKKAPALFEQMINDGEGNDIAVINYTSGTTGIPKATMQTQKALSGIGCALVSLDDWKVGDEWLAFIPLAWAGGHSMDLARPLCVPMTSNLPEKPETVQENIREIAPRGVLFSTRQWEAVNRTVQAKIADADIIKRYFYNLFLPIGYKTAEMRILQEKITFLWRVIYKVSDIFMFRPLRDKLGLLGVKVGYTSGAAISPDIIHFLSAIGVTVKQIYGSSESGLLSSHRGNDIKYDSCGTPLPDVEIRISSDGEILSKSEYRASDYYKAHEEFQRKLINGWYCTGDFGHIDESGHLIVMDRMEDLRSLVGGHKYSPQYIEIKLRFSAYIKEAFVVGDEDRKYIGAIVNIDLDNAGRWAEKRHITYTTFADLSQKPEITDLIRKEIGKINKGLPDKTKIRKFVNLYKELDPDEAELTRSRKLRRKFLKDRYADLIEAIYGVQDEHIVETAITYRDGRKGIGKSLIKVTSVD